MLTRILTSFTLILISLVLLDRGFASAQGTKTSDVLIVSSGRMTSVWPEWGHVRVNDADYYIALGTISLTMREPRETPLEVAVWGRGFDDIVFFEPPLPAQVIADAGGPGDLRKRLLAKSPEEEQATAGLNSDVEKLQRLTARPTPMPTPAAAAVRKGETPVRTPDPELQDARRVALMTLRAMNLESFDGLWEAHVGQEGSGQQTWVQPLDPHALARALDPKGGAGRLNDEDLWPRLLTKLRERRLSESVLRTTVFSAAGVRTVGYLVRLPEDQTTKKMQGEILVAAKGSEPEKMGVALEVERESLAFGSWVRFLNSFFPTVTTVITTFVGAGIGFLLFQAQQKKLREAEAEKKTEERAFEEKERFEERKYGSSTELTAFFDEKEGNYRDHRDAERTDDDEKVRNIRLALIRKGIYRLLPPAEKRLLDEICDGPPPPTGTSRTAALDQLLRRNFQEFMVGH